MPVPSLHFSGGENSRVGVLASITLLLAISGLDAWLNFEPTIQVLYVLPIWFATRLAGQRTGWLLVACSVFAAVFLHSILDVGSHASQPWACATIHAATLGVVMYAIGRLEEAQDRTRIEAMQDPLTGLLNRRALLESGSGALSRASSTHESLVAVVVDCDDFKMINDKFGHAAGDHVLQMLARVLESETRKTDLISRTGGDEFVLIMPGLSEEEASHAMQRVQAEFSRRIRDAGYVGSLSVGLAQLGDEQFSIDELMRQADAEMYTDKARKKSNAFLN